MRAPTHHAARKWHMSSEPRRGSVHACTHVRTLAAEYNSGNTMKLGQSCFDARLRSFHLLPVESFSHVLLCVTVPEVSVSLNDIRKYMYFSVAVSRPRRRDLRVLLCYLVCLYRNIRLVLFKRCFAKLSCASTC